MTLSSQRAKAVADYLSRKNPDLNEGNKMTTNGYGDTKPVNPSDNQNSPEVRSQNRRVEIKVYKAKI